MSNFFYEYMTEEEREFEKQKMQDAYDLKKIQYAMESAVSVHEVRLCGIETKAIVENYTDAQLEAAYTKELEVYTESVKEIFAKLIQKTKNMWYTLIGQYDKIVDAKGLNPNAKIELDAEPGKFERFMQKVVDTANALIHFDWLKKTNEETGEKEADGKKIAIASTIGLLGITTAGAIVMNGVEKEYDAITADGKTYVRVSEGMKIYDRIKTLYDKFIDLIGRLGKKLGEAGDKAISGISTFVSFITSKIQNFFHSWMSKISKALGKGDVEKAPELPAKNEDGGVPDTKEDGKDDEDDKKKGKDGDGDSGMNESYLDDLFNDDTFNESINNDDLTSLTDLIDML